ENVTEFDELAADLLAHGVAQFAVGVATYLPTARSRRYEALRPTLAELRPLVERVRALPGPFFQCEEWVNLSAGTVAAYVRRALDEAWPLSPESRWDGLYLVCRPNLDLYWGVAGRYRRRYGNLRRDDAQAVVRAAVTEGAERSEDALWYA